ncbi:MAG: ORF6N domain-containing protein [Victivallaceae bacterium]|jgi:hypothetical protein
MNEFDIIKSEDIQKRIYTVRGVQVMLDNDIAEFYGVETRRLNEQVKRNIGRFPEAFMFQLSETEFNVLRPQFAPSNGKSLRSQIATLKKQADNLRGQHRKYLPYAFTEQGVAMLSAVLRSETAVKVSVQIMNAFVAMRRFMLSNAQVFQRLGTLELKQLETDRKLDKVLTAIESRGIQPRQGIFFDGQVFDAYQFVSDLFRTAAKSIIIIDNYIDDTVLTHLGKRRKNVKVTIFTKAVSKQLALDIKKFNEQYQPVEVREFNNSHDRFLIIDDKTVYHFGASLKDLGKKWFAFSMFDKEAISILSKLPGGNI